MPRPVSLQSPRPEAKTVPLSALSPRHPVPVTAKRLPCALNKEKMEAQRGQVTD